MKTYYLFTKKNAIFSLFGLLAIITTSCGSYQNSSYYDNDGVYGSERSNTVVENKYSEQNLEKSNKYAEQFKTMQEDYSYFTDVDSYQSQEAQDTVVTVYRNESNNNYAGWGNNSSDVTINYYNNGWGWNNWYSPYWGIGWNWGWNSWYGNNWGWGWNSWYGPGWGWGWNNWYGPGWGGYYGAGWGWNGYYGYGRDVVYNGGRRGGSAYHNPSRGRDNYSNGRTNTPRPNFNSTRSTPRTRENGTRSNVTPRTPRENSTGTPRNNNYSTPRSNNNSTPRTNNNYSTPRSSSGGSFGGSRGGSFGGSSGGGRSGGGSRGGRG